MSVGTLMNQFQRYLSYRYVCCGEAVWRLQTSSFVVWTRCTPGPLYQSSWLGRTRRNKPEISRQWNPDTTTADYCARLTGRNWSDIRAEDNMASLSVFKLTDFYVENYFIVASVRSSARGSAFNSRSRRICDYWSWSWVKLRSTISRPVRPGLRHPSGTRDQFFFLLEIFFRQCSALSDKRTGL
jgi:hypothetical protein